MRQLLQIGYFKPTLKDKVIKETVDLSFTGEDGNVLQTKELGRENNFHQLLGYLMPASQG